MPLTFRRSLTTEGVMSFAFGISFNILSKVALSNITAFASFSFTLPLLHFFFFERLPAMAALSLASFDFCTTLFAPIAQDPTAPGGGPVADGSVLPAHTLLSSQDGLSQ